MDDRRVVSVDLEDQVQLNSPKVIPISEDEDEWFVKIIDSANKSYIPSFNDFTLSYTNSDSHPSLTVRSEYVNVEDNNSQQWSESLQEVAQEHNCLEIDSPFENRLHSSRLQKEKEDKTEES